jgi:hypothetical protein
MADRIIKPDSGNDVIIQNNDASRKIEVTNSGDVEVTGDFKTTTVKATNLKANDGTAGLVVADSTGEVTSSGGLKATNLKATNLKANDGTAGLVVADSTGRVTFSENNPVITLGSNAVFPSGHVIQYVSVLNSTGSATVASDDGSTFGTTVTLSSPQNGSKIVAWALGGKAQIVSNGASRKTKCGLNFAQSGASGTPNFYFSGGTEAHNNSSGSYASAPGVAFAEYTSDGTNDIVISCRVGRFDSVSGQWDADANTPIRITAMEIKQ